jgi:hypothetical protein
MASLTPARAILYGTGTVALLDGLYAVILAGLRGVGPDQVFKTIAAGLLGRDAFAGGLAVAGLGLALHVLIAFMVVTTYYGLSSRLPLWRRRPLLCGPLYGLLVYAVMNLVVIPLSALGSPRFALWQVVGGMLIHAAGVGLPAAFFAARAQPTPRHHAAVPGAVMGRL